MGFRGNFLGIAGSVLLFVVGAAGQSSITVLVNDSAGVGRDVLEKAEMEASRLFEDAGIWIRWEHCNETDACRRRLLRDEFVLHIVPNGKTQSEFVFGEAFLGEDGRGQYSDVFFDRIQLAPENIDVARMLGVVAAHELGHLLLGSRAHSHIGIMEPIWGKSTIRRVGMGTLLFTPDQARLMRRRIGENDRIPIRPFPKTDRDFGLLSSSTPGLRF